MKQYRCFIWLGLLIVSLPLLAGCLSPSSTSQGGGAASPPAAAGAAGARSLAIPAATAKPSIADNTPAPAATIGTIGITSSAPASSSSVTTSTETAPLRPLVTAGSTTIEVTLADQGRTIAMHVGERFLLNLEGGDAWIVEVANQAVLSSVTGMPVPQGAQGLFEALAVGKTALTATNEPACRKASPPCMLPTRSFQVEVVVN
jgi:hypothetical protein